MANMSYCRFQNTAKDLDDCLENFYEADDLSEEESSARKWIIKMAIQIADDCGHEVEE
jgi:hypothetical protein